MENNYYCVQKQTGRRFKKMKEEGGGLTPEYHVIRTNTHY